MADDNDSAPDLSTLAGEARPLRLFVGLKIHEAIARDLSTLIRELDDPAIRRVAIEDIHLTLVPPWPEKNASAAIECLAAVAGRFGPTQLSIRHAGYGPDPRFPRLIWAECVAAEPLAALKAALLAAFGQTEDRPFRPHITLARIRGNGRTVSKRQPFDRPLALNEEVSSVELFQSPAPGERGYKVLASAALSSTALSQ